MFANEHEQTESPLMQYIPITAKYPQQNIKTFTRTEEGLGVKNMIGWW